MISYSTSSLIPPAAVASPASSPQQPLRVLVIDDEEALRRLLRVTLQGAGYQVVMAANAQEALRLVAETRFDILLVDVLMPDMDGHQLCKEIRKTSNVPIMMISALNRTQEIVTGLRVGADDYICKPFQLREIDVRIKALLRWVARCNTTYAPQFT